MIRLLSLFLLLSFFLLAKTSVDTKIEKTSSEIGTYVKTQELVSKKMDETAQAIISHEKEIAAQQHVLKKLQEELVEKEGSYGANVEEIKSLKGVQESLKRNSSALEEELVFTIAQSVSLSIILEEEYSANEESLIEYEVLESMLKNAKAKIKELNRQAVATENIAEQTDIQLQIKGQEKKRLNIQREIFDIEEEIELQRDELIEELKKAKEQTITTTELFTIEWEII